jgi:uncharacterized protein (DUF305 family)
MTAEPPDPPLAQPAIEPTARRAPAAGPRRVPWGPIGLVVALLFLAGCIGWFVASRSSTDELNEVDRGFLVDMSDHHDQAVQLALYELANGEDPITRDFAMEVLLFQRQELGQMAVLMAQDGLARPDLDLDRTAMSWMGMGTPLSYMPGWAQEDQIEALREAEGVEADILFLELMQAHHRGGVHMAEYAADNGSDPFLRDLAARMARNQTIEVNEYQVALDRLRERAADAS